jgi:hypothetical protein
MENLNLPPKVRAAIYVTVVLGTALLVPLHTAHAVSDLVMNVWTSLSGAASLLAVVNVNLGKK